MYLESVAIIPQLYMFQKQAEGVVEVLTSHFVAALGFGRILEFGFWMYSYHELADSNGSRAPGWIALISQFVHICLMADFFYYYWIAVASSSPMMLPTTSAQSNLV
jgi:ER lumen protein retaining receptor